MNNIFVKRSDDEKFLTYIMYENWSKTFIKHIISIGNPRGPYKCKKIMLI